MKRYKARSKKLKQFAMVLGEKAEYHRNISLLKMIKCSRQLKTSMNF